MKKRPRTSASASAESARECSQQRQQPLLRDALTVLLCKSAWLRERETLQRLLLVSRAIGAVVLQWLHETFAADISMGIERIPVPVSGAAAADDSGDTVKVSAISHDPQHQSRYSTQDLLELLGFTYDVQCKYPIPSHQHALSPEGIAVAQRSELAESVLRGRSVRVTVQKHRKSGKGWGVLAAEDIPRGAYIGEYTGDVISTRQMQARFTQRESSGITMNYVLVLRELASRPSDEGATGAEEQMSFSALRTIVDATDRGCFTRLINHSCEPNLTLTAVRLRSLIPHLVLFAKRDVRQGEELSFNYGGGGSAANTAAAAGQDPVITEGDEEGKGRCLCGAASCRGLLPSDSSL